MKRFLPALLRNFMAMLATRMLGLLAITNVLIPSEAVTDPPRQAETLSEHYEVTVNGRPIPVYACRVSAMPFNQVWPGYQRPLEQTELAGFAHWGMSGPVTVEVTRTRAFTSMK